jgi:hypothetical protein
LAIEPFAPDAEETPIISKINPANLHDMSVFHPPIVLHWGMRARSEILPRSGPSALEGRPVFGHNHQLDFRLPCI